MVFVSDSSGRFGTSYIPQCQLNRMIQTKAGVSDNFNYRLYLQRNANELMQRNRSKLISETTGIRPICNKCKNCVITSQPKK